MPIATPQGTLDFKSVDKVTFVGASSNTVIDTTTGSLGVGVGVGGPTSNLHVVGNTRLEGDINMLHTSNTASIKLNSNVVTEFPRSKKLIKYPRVALTSAAETGSGYEGYIVTRSSQFSSYNAWEAFDENNPKGTGQEGAGAGWASTIPGTYSVSTGAETGSVEHHTGSVQGEWIQIQLPESIYLHDFVIESRSETTYNTSGFDHGFPEGCVLYGSNNGSSWANIKSFTTGDKANSRAHTENINEMTRTYKYFALVVNSTHVFQNTTQVSHVSIGQIRLFGTPEYDPDAHGTDVTVKSYPNVPNTDWLEVYYDAKDLTSISGTVADLSGKSVTGSLNGDVSINTSNDVKSFSFDGSGDYISGTLTNTGDFDFTVSTWVFETNGTTNNTVWMIGSGSSTSNPNPSVALGVDSAGSLDFFVFSGTEIRMSNFRDTFGINKWHHIVCTRTGTALKYFINGIDQNRPPSANLDPLSIAANSIFNIGTRTGNQLGNNPMHGKIANFRLFNRVLTSDEIYQLYAYQKEYFGHGDLSMTLKAGRLGIGTSEPRVALDVRGDTFSTLYKGGRTTFLTWDYVGQRYVDIAAIANATSYANVANVLDHTFDIPSCYHSLGTANLKAFVQIDWRGEVHWPWNFGFRIEVTYNGTQIAYSSSSDHAASWNSRVCGVVSDSYHNDYYSTPDFASVTSQYTLNNCDVSPGSTLKVQLVGQHGDTAGSNRVWTGRTNGNHNQADYELPITSFFVILDVDDGY
jgi:hypothetical protein